MRLLRATINGFGKWVDESIDFNNESLVCLYGENEAGKSTMQHFILFMLFGLTPKKRAFYRPKTSSRMGGRLLVSDESFGEYTIERFDEVRNGQALCYTSDGSEYTEDWLKEHLHGMTYQTYQSIFSFSATDLSGIQTMSEADLGDVLLGIGLTGSKNILAIEKDLDNRMGNLFKPYGKKPLMNSQLDKLDQLFQQLISHKNDEDIYRNKKMHIEFLYEKMEALQEQYTNEKNLCTRLEKQHQALPLIEEYKFYMDQLNMYPDSLPFPENGLERLQQLDDKILPLKSELTVLKDNNKEYSEKQYELKQQLYDETIYEQAETLLLSKQTYMANRRDINLLYETIEKGQLQIQSELEQLQIGLTIEDLDGMHFPFHLERKWNELKKTSEQLHLEKEQSEDELFLLKRKIGNLTVDQKKIEESIPNEEKIIQMTDKVEEYHRQSYIHSQSDTKEKSKLKWQKTAVKRKKQSHIILTSSVILSILLSGLAILENTSNTFFIISLFVLVAGVSQWIWQKQSTKSLSALFADEEWATEISITKEEKENAAQELFDIRKKQQTLHTLLDHKKSLEIKMLQWEEKEQRLQAKESRLNKQLQKQYELHPFLRKINLTYWTEMFQKLQNILQFYKKQIDQKEELTILKSAQEGLMQELATFFEQLEWAYDRERVESQYETLGKWMEQYHAAISRMEQFDEWMEKNNRNQQEVNQRLMTYERGVETLYQHANVHTSEEFYKQANNVEEKEKFKNRKRQLEYQITSILAQTEFKKMLSKSIDAVDLQGKIEDTKHTMDELATQKEEIRQEFANENAILTNMETSDNYSETTHRFQMEQEQLQKWAYEWSVLKTAKEMLIETKRIFRDKYLYKVIDKTSDYFSTLTAGRYKRIFAPSESTLFQVESVDLVRYNVRELSKGTIDQLYISLRIAISEVLSQDLLLPFIIDDAFVHFDSIRTERMMGILAELAGKQQIIIFTNNKDVLQFGQHSHRINLTSTVRING